MNDIVLSMRNITKRFPGSTVLDDVSIDVRGGEVHAIVGENGAGKSTLMNVLAGVHQPDGGRILLDGRETRFHHPAQALEHGISVIHQELTLLPDRTVAENVLLGREPRRRMVVDRRAMEERTAELLAELGAETISPRALVRRLSIAHQQLAEIAKGLSYDPRILVMDEPTAALPPADVQALFGVVRRLVERGRAVLYISHRLGEIFELAQRASVLKDGKLVGTVDLTDPDSRPTPAGLVRMMVGQAMTGYYPDRAKDGPAGPVRLAVRGLSTGMLRDVDLEVRGGEIAGVTGLDGSGRTELGRALFGAGPPVSGRVAIDGRDVRLRTPRAAARAGIAYLTADRKSEGLVLPLSARDNGLLAVRARSRRAARAAGSGLATLAARTGLGDSALRREVRLLSGGNQQKVVLVKWLATGAGVYVFDEPTRGVDVGAKAGIHRLMRELADDGAAIIMISSELPEVIGMSDRILVMREGGIAGELPAGADEAGIMLLAAGQAGDAP